MTSTRSRRGRALAPLAALVALAAACSTTQAVPLDHDDGSIGDDAATSDGASGGGDAATGDDGGGGSVSCPATAPAAGTPCPTVKTVCEYGGEGDHVLCATRVECVSADGGSSGTWAVTGGPAGCVGTPAQNPAACPASFTALAPGSTCPSSIASRCVYDEGICACVGCVADGGGGPLWGCTKWSSAPAGCPSPRPLLGTPCRVEGKECDYATVCTAVSLAQPDMKCANGTWTDVPVPQPPCAVPSCSPL